MKYLTRVCYIAAFAIGTGLALTPQVKAEEDFSVAIRLDEGVPPRPIVKEEVKTERPSSEHRWIPGHWALTSDHHDWTWREGRWERPPHPRAVWVQAGTIGYDGEWYHIPGHWRIPKD